MTKYEKFARLVYESQNLGGEINMCDLCYYKDNDLCEWEKEHCIRGVALKIESEVEYMNKEEAIEVLEEIFKECISIRYAEALGIAIDALKEQNK